MSKKTIVINLFSGPGCGKSTYAAGLFYKLKLNGVNAELVREFAKDKTWLNDFETLSNQAYTTTKQYFRQCVLDGKVDVIVTDSPILLGLAYPGRGLNEHFEKWLLSAWEEFDNHSFLLKRNPDQHPYNPKGRNQTEEEAMEKDRAIENLLKACNISYEEVEVSRDNTLDKLYEISLQKIS